MDWKDRVDFGELVRRFDQGDRDADLLAQLNRAAYDCFHAPWETLPAPKPRGPHEELQLDLVNYLAPETPSSDLNPLRLTQGHRPIEEGCDQDVPSTNAQNPAWGGVDEPSDDQEDPPEPEDPQEHGQNSLAMLAKTLETMGHWVYMAGETRLLVELPYDPKTDSVSWLTFLVDQGKGLILIMSQNDIALERVTEADLERYCRRYNRRSTGMTAVIHRPQEGARPRLRLTGALPNHPANTARVLTVNLERLFRIERQFWSYMRKCRPI